MNSVVFQFADASTPDAALQQYGAAVQTAVAGCTGTACACGGAVAASELRILTCNLVRACDADDTRCSAPSLARKIHRWVPEALR